MKILCVNCHPDFTYFKNKGLNLDVSYETTNKVFPLKYAYQAKDKNGQLVSLFTPDVTSYVKQFKGYSAILVGWNSKNYGEAVKNTGGYTFPTPLEDGTFYATFRIDSILNNNYPIHEMMHILCNIININLGDHVPKDFMDSTLVNGQWLPYYINDYNSTNPDSNYNRTWKGIIPFIPTLNALQSPKTSLLPKVILTRISDNGVETIGNLRLEDNSFGCDTLELAWKGNQRNISCIPKGEYLVKKVFSLRFGYVYEVQNVPDRTYIYFHEGNYFFSTKGCILLGSLPKDINGDRQIDVQNSKLIREAFQKKMNWQPFNLKIQ